MAAAHALQDGVRVEQADVGDFDVPDWSQEQVETMRNALMLLASVSTDSAKSFGRRTGPGLLAPETAIGWGGLPATARHLPQHLSAQRTTAAPPTRFTVDDVPVDGFWSITLYDDEGWMPVNEYNAYSPTT
ncbi:MAG: hypothetical protein R3A10_13435 [Caldilineaceae bacterium]